MKSLMDVAEVFAIDVRIDLCGRDIGVTQHLLHGGQVCATLEQVRSKAVSQCVWSDSLLDACPSHMFLQDLPDPHAG